MNAYNFALENNIVTFPNMVVFPEIEVLTDNTVLLSLTDAKDEQNYIGLTMKAKPSTSYTTVNHTNDPQNDVDIDFESLVVDTTTHAIVDEVEECHAVIGMRTTLTEQQATALNALLKMHFETATIYELTDWVA